MGVPRSPLFHRFSASTTKHGVFHDLPTFSGPRVFAKAHHLDPGKLASSWRKQVLFHVLLLLGHSASSSGSAPLHKHVSAITAFPPPTVRPALQGFLGMVNFYRKFIRGAALILRPLTDALRQDPKEFSWSPQMDSAFVSAKSALALVPTLAHPDPSAQLLLMLLAPMWKLFLSSLFKVLGLLLLFTLRNSLLRRQSTPPSTLSSWLHSLL